MARKAGQKIIVKADHREVPGGIPDLLGRDPDIALEIVNNMEHADYDCIGLMIERKTARDLADSICDGRIGRQHNARLDAGVGTRCLLIVEGNPYDSGRDIGDVQVRALLSWLAALEGNTVLMTANSRETAYMIKQVASHAQYGLAGTPTWGGRRAKTPKEMQLQVVMGLDGVGPKRAELLLEHFGSVRALFSATLDQLMKVPKFGAAASQKVLAVLDNRWGQ